MSFGARILTHSYAPHLINPVTRNPCEVSTWEFIYPRSVHGELMTHRVFSRNAASSRAIPIHVLQKQIKEDPYIPIYWGKNQSGMQAFEELTDTEIARAKDAWLLARDHMLKASKDLLDIGMHKQEANRILEPWMWMKTLVSTTELNNFFSLRRHHMAHPAIEKVASMAVDLYEDSTPNPLAEGEWHLPLWGFPGDEEEVRATDRMTLTHEENDHFVLPTRAIVSAGRCARISYLTHEGVRDISKDIELSSERLATNGHYSPWEHPCTPMSMAEWEARMDLKSKFESMSNHKGWLDTSDQFLFSGNFRGFHQARKFFTPEAGNLRPIEGR